ncbi:hypothetical protein JCM11251_003380 [Rhodosporidiobolus azoricus]
MATALPAVVVIATFPSLSRFLAPSPLPSSLVSTVSSAASRSDTLTVLIRTRTHSPTLDPWSPPDPHSHSSSSSSATPPSAPHPSAPLSSPVSLWLNLERALAQLYSTATSTFLRRGNVLARVDVVVEPIRQVPFCVPNGTEVERWDWDTDGGDTVDVDGKGKGVQKDEEQERLPRPAQEGTEARPPIYDVVALGGTFDHLHAGHKILLSMACSIASRKVIVGVSDDTLLKNKKLAHLLEPLSVRMRNVERFMDLVRPGVEKEVVPLTDVYGPTAHDPSIQALVVSDETRAGGDTINTLRAEKGLNPLDIHVINLVADDHPPSPATATSPIPNPRPSPVPAVKVEPAAKMGSTGIREWIERQRLKERGSGGGAGEEVLDKAGGTI